MGDNEYRELTSFLTVTVILMTVTTVMLTLFTGPLKDAKRQMIEQCQQEYERPCELFLNEDYATGVYPYKLIDGEKVAITDD